MNSTSVINDTGAGFDVVVTNATGSATSATATLTVRPFGADPDFRTQDGKMTIPADESSGNAKAPNGFDAVVPARTIALISGITQHAMGWTKQTTQDPNDISLACVWLMFPR